MRIFLSICLMLGLAASALAYGVQTGSGITLEGAPTAASPSAPQAPKDTVYGYWGIEMQVYPTGLLPGIHWERGFGRGHHVHARIGVNLFDHRDLGEQDNERGWGWGGGAGWRWYLPRQGTYGQQGWLTGARVDVWRNTVEWSNELFGFPFASGSTKLVVLQPTVEAGYRFAFGRKWTLSPHLGVGWEWNAVTDGSPTGEGPIGLVGVRFAYQSCHRPR